MKKLVTLSLFCFIVITQVLSQSCLPYGININSQAVIDSFQINYPGCTEIEGSVMISNQGTSNITNLNGLSAITSIGGYLIISENNALHELDGLENLISVGGDIEIEDNYLLENLEAMANLASIGGHLYINNNHFLESLQGLNNLNSIGGHLIIFNNDHITNLSGFTSLTTIGGYLNITNNELLMNLDGLENLTTIGGVLGISGNPDLTNLDGLISLTSIDGNIHFTNNDLLVSLQGLQNTTSINGSIRITENSALTSLEGLDNISAASIQEITIYINSSLSTCEAESICDYLVNPTGDITIFGNASGCDSIDEVMDACMVGISQYIEESFLIFPNPVQDILNIEIRKDEPGKCYVTIYDISGKLILEREISSSATTEVNTNSFEKGFYMLQMRTDKNTYRQVFIKH